MARPARTISVIVIVAAVSWLAFYLGGKFMHRHKAEELAVQQEQASPSAPVNPGGPSVVVPAPPPPAAGQAGAGGAVGAPGEQAKKPVSEDSVVPSAFFRDLARYCVAQFQPAHTRRNPGDRPANGLSVSRLNARFGLDENAFGKSHQGAESMRRHILSYVFQPGFVPYLYNNYADLFLDQLREAVADAHRDYKTAKGYSSEPLHADDAAAMLHQDSALAAEAGKILAAVSSSKEITARVAAEQAAAAKVAAAYERVWAAADKNQLGPEADAIIRLAVADREAARNGVIRAVLAKTGPLPLEDDEVFYIATWGARRANTPGQSEGLAAAAKSLTDLSGKLAGLAEEYASGQGAAPSSAPAQPDKTQGAGG
ncbi:hypothetical protein dsx2_0521 [Desulfovibrio sp. X2]|uniref:hypothetical protein n=1 Tax=Desulfovibrio sp. X2 TaxID=941449 RepID=UPI000358ACBD|nr:hypothetical protein [Desulfovibrio sp. X2]EPR38712.1 hypothetical protein dsx2_0521 [Desulfovibrio sp. X2]